MSSDNQAVKLILNYDVVNTDGQEYYRFVMGKYLPEMQKLGFEMLEAWTHSWDAEGDLPNRVIELVCRDSADMDSLLDSDEWEALNDELDQYIANFSYKFLPYRAGVQV